MPAIAPNNGEYKRILRFEPLIPQAHGIAAGGIASFQLGNPHIKGAVGQVFSL